MSLVRTKADPLPGLTWRNSITRIGLPSILRDMPFLMSLEVVALVTTRRASLWGRTVGAATLRTVGDIFRACIAPRRLDCGHSRGLGG